MVQSPGEPSARAFHLDRVPRIGEYGPGGVSRCDGTRVEEHGTALPAPMASEGLLA